MADLSNSKKKQRNDLDKSIDNLDDKMKDNSVEIIQVEQELNRENPRIFEGIKPEKRKEILQTFTKFTIKHHSGPLPEPDTLIKYNSVIPDGANRIMIMAEKQQEHRMSLESKAVNSQLGQSKTGQILGFVLALFIISTGTYLAMQGHEKMGGTLVGTTLISLVVLFVLGKRPKSSE
jgi:uncharacterized membrane protein